MNILGPHKIILYIEFPDNGRDMQNMLGDYIYRVSQEECKKLRESVPYVKIYRYNPKHLYPTLNGYGDNGHRKVGASVVFTHCKLPADSPNACRSFSKVSYYILNCIPSG
jgi:hypothetical protein